MPTAKDTSSAAKLDGEAAVQAALAAMPEADRVLGEGLHALLGTIAPELVPRLWYGMPAYARGGKVICFFQGAHKFRARYATLGFLHDARLDDGAMWPVAYAVTRLTSIEEEAIAALVRRALG